MSNIEPTEEQKQAAIAWAQGPKRNESFVDAVARLLAEREAKLREELERAEAAATQFVGTLHKIDDVLRAAGHTESNELRRVIDVIADVDTLRARVAELEAKIADAVFSCPGCGRHDFGFFASQIKAACGPCRTRAEAAEAREAQHLADIKASLNLLKESRQFLWLMNTSGPLVEFRAIVNEHIARLAHYDDAKAAEGEATCPKCTDDARPVGDGERWVCSVCRRPCRIPLNDAEGGEG